MDNVSLESLLASCPEMLFVAEPEGRVGLRSAAFAERFGGDELALSALARVESRAALANFLEGLVAGGPSGEHVFAAADGGGAVRCRARRDQAGVLHGSMHVLAAAGDERVAAPGGETEIDGTELATLRIEHKLLRAVLDNLDIVLWAVDGDGVFLYHDGKAQATVAPKPGALLGQRLLDVFGEDSGPGRALRRSLRGEAVMSTSEVYGLHWRSWHIPQMNAQGEVDTVVGISLDISDAKNTEAELQRQLTLITQQKQAIQELSTPLIEVWDQVIAVPLVGVIDTQRANDLITRTLAEISHSGAAFAILDLTGVEALETSTASHLIRLLSSIELLGAEGLITGISPFVAQTMVGIGIDLTGVRTCATLRDGLRYCMAKEG